MAIHIFVGLFMMPFVIHELGKVVYGFWVLLQSLLAYSFLLDFGVRSSLNRHLAKFYTQSDHQLANQVLNTGLVIYLFVCIVVVALSCLLGATFNYFFSFQALDSATIFWVVVLIGSSVALQFPAAVFDAVLTGLQRYDLMNLSQVLSLLIRTGLVILSLKLGHGLLVMSLATLLGSLLNLVLNYVFAARIWPLMKIDLSLSGIRTFMTLANHSFYAFILIGATRIITDAGNIIVGAFVNTAAVTFYSVANSLTSYATSAISGISTTIPPAASSLEAKGDRENLKILCLSGTKFILLVGLPILLTFILQGKGFLQLWVGEEFSASYLPLVLLSISWAFNYLQTAAACVLIGLSLHKRPAMIILMQATLNLGLSLLLVRSMGMLGVAGGALIASVVMNLIIQIHALRVLEISFRRFLIHVIVPTTVALVPFVVTLEILFLFFPPTGLLTYFLHVSIAVNIMLIFLPWLGLNRSERHKVWYGLNRWWRFISLSTP